MRRAKSMCVYDVKTQKLQARGTPCKCCSRSQQRSSPGLRLRLTVLFVLIARVWWISHYLISSSFALDSIWQSTSHTPVVEEVAGPRDICQAVLTAIFPSGVLQQLFECLPRSLPDITYQNNLISTLYASCCYCSNQRPVVGLANQPGYTNHVPVDGK